MQRRGELSRLLMKLCGLYSSKSFLTQRRKGAKKKCEQSEPETQ